jgi:ribosomal protein S12 methylthiotransferase accessory factor
MLTQLVRVPRRPHDPAVHISAGQTPPWFEGEVEFGGSGAGWTAEDADLACLGEALERVLARALPCDHSIESSWEDWTLDERPIAPQRWVLFHEEQYPLEGFPFAPFTDRTICRWVCCREATTGEPVWAPEEFVFLSPRRGECQQFLPGYSTGLSCGRRDDPVLLRGVQEVVERDALVGAWWGAYPLEEWPAAIVLDEVEPIVRQRIERPNLEYRFYRVETPYSDHVTLVSVSGTDAEGWIYSVGSACRETRRQSWEKSLLEAIQGRHCVRQLLARHVQNSAPRLETPTTFFEHALYYTLYPDRLHETPLMRATPAPAESDSSGVETFGVIQSRLGPQRPILFRDLTPPGLAPPDWRVLRVLVPRLQPLHGDHRFPFLGGPLWSPRRWSDWSSIPPHPFA